MEVPVFSDVIEALDKMFGKMHSHLNEIKPMVPRAINMPVSQATDSSGNLEVKVSTAPVGKGCTVGRIVVLADGYTPAYPWIGSAGSSLATGSWFGLFSGKGMNLATMPTFQPYPPNLLYLPAVAEFSGHNAIPFDGGEDIYFGLQNGPASVNITVIVTAWMTDNRTSMVD